MLLSSPGLRYRRPACLGDLDRQSVSRMHDGLYAGQTQRAASPCRPFRVGLLRVQSTIVYFESWIPFLRYQWFVSRFDTVARALRHTAYDGVDFTFRNRSDLSQSSPCTGWA